MNLRAITKWIGCALVGGVLLQAAPALAADMAEFRVIGYSEDGRHFAFEQFGIQDGSGFAYADIFVLELERDRWVGGSPYRVRADDEAERLIDVRLEVEDLAAEHLQDLNIDVPARVLAATTSMEHSDQEAAMRFHGSATRTPIGPEMMMRLVSFPLNSTRDCFGMVETAGFALSLQEKGGQEAVIYRDQRIPSSRICPAEYGLAAIVRPFDGASGRAVALISVYQLGFEGLDRRFLAVPFDLPF